MLIVKFILQIRCKITIFFAYTQVYFAKKCRFFDFAAIFNLNKGLLLYHSNRPRGSNTALAA